MNSFYARLRTWLNTLPIQDPVQRQMASLLQVTLLGLMALVILATAALLLFPSLSLREKSEVLVGDIIGFCIVLLPFILLRRGYFRSAVLIIITILFITPALAITVVFDLQNSGGILFQFTLAILLSGLLVDRRTLWVVYGLSAVIVAFSAIQMQNGEADPARRGMETAVNYVLFNGLMALFLDRFGITLRNALSGALIHERELEGEISNRKQAEERSQIIFESAPDAILLVDRQGNIVMVNSQAEKYFGFKRAELVGSSVDGLVPERFRGGHASFRAGFLADPQTRPMGAGRDLFGVRKDGSEFPVEIGLTPLETQDGRMVMATIVDITGRKQAESAALENEARYHHILDAMMEGCQIIDFDWRYVYVNDVVAGQGQRSRRELLHHTMMEMYPGIENSELFTLLRRCMEERIPQRMENQFHFPDGGIGWFELSIQPAREGIFILSTDITERKRVEKQLEKQNQRLKALREIDTAILAADSTEVIVGAALSHILELVECRRVSLALIDRDNSEALIFDVKADGETFMPRGTRVPLDVSHEMIPILEKNQPVLIDDLAELPDPPLQFQAGIEEGFRSVCVLPLFSQNSLIGMFNLSSDQTGFFDDEKISLGREVANQVAIAITQNRLFAELRELNADLEQRVAERTLQLESANRELEAFSYSVSHDLRAPLRAINGFSLALSTRHADSLGEEGTHYLNRILENTRHMGDLIDDMLSLSRITRREMEAGDVDLSVIAQEIAGELRRLEPERQVAFEIEDQLEVRGDAGLIRVVLHNLIGNAWKFTSSRAQAKIRFGVAASLAAGEGKSDEGETVYYVEDNGVGFDMAYVDKLFGAFQRLHSMAEFPGTGIGLATVLRIIQRHGGRIWADAQLDQGATFYFTLGGRHEKQ